MSEIRYYTEYVQTGNTLLLVEDTITINRSTHKTGFGTLSPTEAKVVVSGGTIQIVDGTQAAGRVFTSNTSGVGSWQAYTGNTSGTAGTSGVNGFSTDPTFYFDPSTDRMYTLGLTVGTGLTYTGPGYNTSGNVLKTDGTGVATWGSVGTGSAGTSGNSGTSDPDLYFDTATNTLYTPNITMTGSTVTISNIQNAADNNTKLILESNILKQVTGSTTRTFSWNVLNPAVGGIPGPRLATTSTLTRIDAYVTGVTNCIFTVETRDIGGGGSTLLTAGLTGTTSGVSATFGSTVLTGTKWLWLNILSVSGTPTYLIVTITATGGG